ncbi:MAG: hypothetical protein AB1485_07155 [Candidatus Thermoplasmatota archaeon]
MKFRIFGLEAQTMLANGIIFFIILLLCSSLIFTSNLKIISTRKITDYRLKYAESTINILMGATIPKCWYTHNNKNITLDNKTVSYLIIFDLWCRSNGTADIITLENCIEEAIENLADSLITCYSYALLATYHNATVLISSHINNLSELPVEYATSTIAEKMFYLPGDATISLVIW